MSKAPIKSRRYWCRRSNLLQPVVPHCCRRSLRQRSASRVTARSDSSRQSPSRTEGRRHGIGRLCLPPPRKNHRTDDPMVAFKDANWCLLVGSKPRGPGMERADLLKDNGKIFIGQGQAIDAVAADDARVAVVGNPCNTNCMIGANQCKRITADRWTAMTRASTKTVRRRSWRKKRRARHRHRQHHHLWQPQPDDVCRLLPRHHRRQASHRRYH